MRLSDVMSAMQLSGYAELGLILFIIAYAGIVAHVFARARAGDWERARHLPLDSRPDSGPPDAQTAFSKDISNHEA